MFAFLNVASLFGGASSHSLLSWNVTPLYFVLYRMMVLLRILDAPPPLRVSHRKLCFTPVITIKLFTAKKIQYNTFPVYLKAHIKLPYHYEWSASLSRTCVRCQLRLNCVKGAEPLCCFPSECLRNNWDFYELEKKKNGSFQHRTRTWTTKPHSLMDQWFSIVVERTPPPPFRQLTADVVTSLTSL